MLRHHSVEIARIRVAAAAALPLPQRCSLATIRRDTVALLDETQTNASNFIYKSMVSRRQ
jgi:hypothetical protein